MRYDASNRLNTTIGATGSTTFALTGTSPTFSFSQSVGVGTTAPSARIESRSTTEQLRLSFDASNSARFTATSAGYLNVVTTGSRVMIGSGTPNNALEIADGIFGINRNVGSGNLSMFRFYRSNSEKMRIGIDSND